MKPKVYLIGPMSGIKDDNRPAFRKAAKWLRTRGWPVISPDELDESKPPKEAVWENYLRRDILWGVLKAKALVALPGWRQSRGAKLEACIAESLKIPVYEFAVDKQGRLSSLHLVPSSELPVPVFLFPTEGGTR